MFSTLFALSTLAILAAATPTARQASSCTTGAVQCCQSTTTASDPAAASLLGLLGIVLQDVNIPVGLNCSPISVVGAGGGTCSANTVCCEDNSHGGLISIGCLPVSL
ncbi:fungal hydrophobin-domain-containing protein [Fomes fomentarius]|nr:fungal hydrophobin-domain-containing protein [Fomes fomentarius]